MKTPILETSRLWLKPLKEEDAPGAFLWTGDPKVSWYMRYETHGSLEDTKQWLREEEKQLDSDLLYDFGFHKKDSDELIGSGGLTFNQQQGIWELGLQPASGLLEPGLWNRGGSGDSIICGKYAAHPPRNGASGKGKHCIRAGAGKERLFLCKRVLGSEMERFAPVRVPRIYLEERKERGKKQRCPQRGRTLL